MHSQEEFVRALHKKTDVIYKYLVKIGAAPKDAEDIVQESLYKLMLYIDSIDPTKAYSWLFRVAINQYYDLCRRQNKEIQTSFEHLEFVDDSFLPEDFVAQDEMRKEIQVTLDQLPPLQKQLLLLKYEMELSYADMAELLNLNPGTVKTYLFRARQTFKKRYKKE
ncbi:RNA polymerase sigma-70 factor (ECF subfamily) [Sinobaca qinghaiensis]|uniref:RNA polymerase sigma-70 factor (ECF subfamily) n=1 Tax=Sinobaca qinghaiensis TaxID=342944 RepID=A0A419UWT2_9BACL|nr:RNA polymerase sigma factor [Sinobaca qinghaiensis]RKD69595.1 RNA polymerase sigma-70 factor (ECF subfamily) [Sinobaca qinghaiensis]